MTENVFDFFALLPNPMDLPLSLSLTSFHLQEVESWVLIGKMIDKVCFWVALLLFALGTVAIFLTGHFNQAPEFPFPGENKPYTPP